LTVAFWGTHLG